MDSDDSEVPDVVYTVDIQPYQFEQVRDSSNRLSAKNSGSEDSDIDHTETCFCTRLLTVYRGRVWIQEN